MFLKNRNISSKIKRSKVTDYAALILIFKLHCKKKKRNDVYYLKQNQPSFQHIYCLYAILLQFRSWSWFSGLGSKIVSEYDQEIPQSQTADNLRHREEELLNHHQTPERQIKQSNQLSLPNKMIAILEWT